VVESRRTSASGPGQAGGINFDEARTNVYKLYRACRIGPDTKIEPSEQVAFYDPGLGSASDGASGHFDMIFTMALLQCLHPSSEWVFKEITDRTTFLITIEDELEHSFAWRHFPRNYKKVFERLGMKQIASIDCSSMTELGSQGEGIIARVFVKSAIP